MQDVDIDALLPLKVFNQIEWNQERKTDSIGVQLRQEAK
jgi:hypothetical protein